MKCSSDGTLKVVYKEEIQEQKIINNTLLNNELILENSKEGTQNENLNPQAIDEANPTIQSSPKEHQTIWNKLLRRKKGIEKLALD